MSRADLPEVLLSEEQIQARIREIAAELNRDYVHSGAILIGVLTGAVPFMADLMRLLEIDLEIDFVATASYGSRTSSSGEVRLLKDLGSPISGKHVIVVEDIVDTGLTLRFLLEQLKARQPASLATCVLLDKPSRRVAQVPVDYRGFEIPDQFVVGYGLDLAGKYRNLRYLGVLSNALAVEA